MRAAAVMFFVLLTAVVARADTGADHVKVDLIADTTAVQPGKPFTVGVRFKIDPGWHIYWTNPGDSGLPTTVKLALPAGFTAGPVQFPTPQVLRFPGDIINYGYEGEAMMLVQVTPPATAVPPTAEISADAAWLVCQERCLPGRARARLQLPIGQPTPANASAFDAARALLPVVADPDHVVTVSSSCWQEDGRGTVVVSAVWKGSPPKSAALVLDAVPDWDCGPIKPSDTGPQLFNVNVVLTPTAKRPLPDALSGVLVYTTADGRRHGLSLSIKRGAPPDSGPPGTPIGFGTGN